MYYEVLFSKILFELKPNHSGPDQAVTKEESMEAVNAYLFSSVKVENFLRL